MNSPTIDHRKLFQKGDKVLLTDSTVYSCSSNREKHYGKSDLKANEIYTVNAVYEWGVYLLSGKNISRWQYFYYQLQKLQKEIL